MSSDDAPTNNNLIGSVSFSELTFVCSAIRFFDKNNNNRQGCQGYLSDRQAG